MKELDEHIESIITRKISSTITADEQVILKQWMAERSANASHFHELERIYLNANPPKEDRSSTIDVEMEWNIFNSKIRGTTQSGKPSFTWLQIAASITLIAVAGYFIWANQFKSNTVQVVAQTWGEIIILPDSTEITLNKGAKITYPRVFSKTERVVSLEGEAFFEVTRNKNKPFIVKMSQSTVEVLGTTFNINENNGNNQTEVVVNTGRVRFSNTSLAESVILTKGEKGMLKRSNDMITKTINYDVNVLAWKTRKIVFNEMELDKVIKTINSLYDAQITFSTDIGTNCNVTVSFENQSLEAVLSVLELTLNLTYEKSGDIIVITKTGC